jgi:hypothetical protein
MFPQIQMAKNYCQFGGQRWTYNSEQVTKRRDGHEGESGKVAIEQDFLDQLTCRQS